MPLHEVEILRALQPHPTLHALPWRDPLLAIARADRVLRIEALPLHVDVQVQSTAGGIAVHIDGVTYTLELPAEHVLHILTGDGDDRVHVESTPDIKVVIQTRGGDDAVRVVAHPLAAPGSAGCAVIHGGPGNDHLQVLGLKEAEIDAGAGDDTVHSTASHSTLYAAEGVDAVYVDQGRALIEAMSGDNAVANGPLDDRVFGHPGSVSALSGFSAPLLIEAWNTPLPPHYAATFEIQGDSDYIDTVTRHLNLLHALESAVTLLEDLAAMQARVVIHAIPELDNAYATFDPADGDPKVRHGQRGDRVLRSQIGYNPLAHRPDTPSLVMLYHELCHVWNFATGSVIGNSERQVVGLDTGETFDFDDDPQTPETGCNPSPFNENALRQELGLPARLSYP